MTDRPEQDELAPPEDTQAGGALSNRGIARAAMIVMAAYILSAVLGLLRQTIITASFGATAQLDAYVAATRIPELLFNLIAGGALGSAFIPVFSSFLAKDQRDDAWRLASTVFVLLTLLTGVLATVVYILAPWVVQNILLPGDIATDQALTVELLRIMLSTVVIFSGSGLLMGILNAQQHFWRPALAMSLYNLGIIGGALFLTDALGIHGLAWGSVIGASLHLLVQVPHLFKIDALWRPSFDIRTPGVIAVLGLMLPRILGQAVVQINFVVVTAFASFMVDGAQSSVWVAFTLMFTVLGVIGQSVGTAVFPSLSRLAAEEDWDRFRAMLSGTARSMLFLAVPATVGVIMLASPLVQVLFERGEWSSAATAGTAWALQFFAIGLVGHALLEILARSFYALHDTWTPVIVGVCTMALNILLNIVFIRLIGEPGSLARGPFAGLALAMSVATLIEAGVLWLLLRRRVDGLDERRVWALLWRAGLASLGMALAVWGVVQLSLHVFLTLLLGMGVGVGVYFALTIVLGVEEAQIIPRMVLSKVRR